MQKIINPPIAPEKAIRFLIQGGFTNARKFLCVARITSGYICSRLSGRQVDQFLRTVYEEDYHTAYEYVKKAYNSMHVAVPRHIHALYSCFTLWKLFMHLVYDTTSDFEVSLMRYNHLALIAEEIENAFPPALWKEFRTEPIYDS